MPSANPKSRTTPKSEAKRAQQAALSTRSPGMAKSEWPSPHPQVSPRAPGLKPSCNLWVRPGTLLLTLSAAIKTSLLPMKVLLHPGDSLLSSYAFHQHPQHGFHKGRRAPRAGRCLLPSYCSPFPHCKPCRTAAQCLCGEKAPAQPACGKGTALDGLPELSTIPKKSVRKGWRGGLMQRGAMQQLHTPAFLQHCRLGIPKSADVGFNPTYEHRLQHIIAGTPRSYRQPPIHGCCLLPGKLGEGCSGRDARGGTFPLLRAALRGRR